MRHIVLILLAWSLTLPLMAENKNKHTKQEFRAKKEAYIKEKAGLTDEEAEKFFPLYFQLEDLKKNVNEKAWNKARTGEIPNTSEEEYQKIINSYFDMQVQVAELEKEFIEKFKAIISGKKIYLVYRTEITFNRNMLKIMHPEKKTKKKGL